MTFPVQKLGDANNGGGIIVSSMQGFVDIQGMPICVMGSAVSSHASCPIPPTHCAAVTTFGSSFVDINGIPINKMGDADSCQHVRVAGSNFVFVSN